MWGLKINKSQQAGTLATMESMSRRALAIWGSDSLCLFIPRSKSRTEARLPACCGPPGTSCLPRGPRGSRARWPLAATPAAVLVPAEDKFKHSPKPLCVKQKPSTPYPLSITCYMTGAVFSNLHALLNYTPQNHTRTPKAAAHAAHPLSSH